MKVAEAEKKYKQKEKKVFGGMFSSGGIYEDKKVEEILSLKEDKVRAIIEEADAKLNRERHFIERRANRILSIDAEDSIGNINREL